MKLSQNQRGTGIVEMLLVLVIVGAIGFTGWYVWNSKKSSDDALNKSGNGTAAEIKQKDTPNLSNDKETADWLLYTAPENQYSIRLADGWKLFRYMKSESLYAFDTVNVTYKSGTKATVTQVEGGKDGSSVGLFINYYARSEDASGKMMGDSCPSLKTAQGVSVLCYKYVEKEATSEGIGGLPQNGILYSYVGSKGEQTFNINYGIGPDDKDDHLRVEQAVKTFTFN